MATKLTYAVITPARNEAQFIEMTLHSMMAQTYKPLRWVIVSDGSTDGTDDIVRRYIPTNPWIQLLRMPERRERHFGGKVMAFNAGLARLRDVPYDAIVSLDADITFEPDYFSFLLNKLAAHPHLGLIGTPYRELSGRTYDYRFVNIEDVMGACQVFRRSCYEAIGGYVPVRGGSIDHIAVITARMIGWQTLTFTEKHCIHHRTAGTAEHGLVASKFREGLKDYAVGNHPLWELFRITRQMIMTPRLIGGLAVGTGYAWALLRHSARPVPQNLIEFHRREQMRRLRSFLQRGPRASGPSARTNESSTVQGETRHRR